MGDRTYLNKYDLNTSYGPGTAGFQANSANLAKVIFTSFFDDAATTTYTDPSTGVTTTVTPALPTIPGGSGSNQPTPIGVPDSSRWSGLTIDAGAVAVVNSAVFRYGGGPRNTAQGTDPGIGSFNFHHALEIGGGGLLSRPYYGIETSVGAFVSITNNVFNYNADVGMNIDPQALLAGDPLRPLLTGDAFIHGNIFQNNDLDGVGIAGGTGIPVAGTHSSNLDSNSTWTGGDFTYILRDTIVLGPDSRSTRYGGPNGDIAQSGSGGVYRPPSPTTVGTTPAPNVTLTLQSTLPGTVLADGTVVAAPGIPLVIKTLNNGNSPIPTEAAGVNPGANGTSSWAGGAGFIVGADDGTLNLPGGNSLVDDGAFSQIRILGIPANQSTGQIRVPVIITSVNDNTVGTTVGNTTFNQVIAGNTTQARGGDGGIIYFGANALATYNLQDPRSGSVIDNADIRYMTRIEQQGGGIGYVVDRNADMSFTAQYDDPFNTLFGLPVQVSPAPALPTYVTQYNSPRKLTLSNSNFSSFSDVGFVANPGFSLIGINSNFASDSLPLGSLTRSGINGEPNQTYMVNNTFSNMVAQTDRPGRGTAIELISQTGNDADNNGVAATATMAVILNNTFYNNGIAINSVAPAYNNLNPFTGVSFLAMDNIFSNNTTAAVQVTGLQYQSNLQFNLFNANGADLVGAANSQFFNGSFNNNPISGDPLFRDPTHGNFTLKAGSAAIDRARSEIGPTIFGNMLNPAATLTQTSVDANGNTIFYDTSFLPTRNFVGDSNARGGAGGSSSQDIITLPGLAVSSRGFPDQWMPTLITAPLGTPISAIGVSATTPGTIGNGFSASTYAYVPYYGQRDQAGNLRNVPASNNRGFGSSPFIDLGAYEYLPQNPPVVTSVTSVSGASTTPTNLYVANGIVGTNQSPSQIRVGFNERLNAATLTPSSVLLIGSGGDGVFGNGNDISYNLNNRLSYDTSTNMLIVNTSGLLPTGRALNDEYRLTLKGTGSAIIRDTDGLALDGDTSNNTTPLPSGADNFPGSDFLVSFTIDTNPPTLTFGSFGLAAGTFTTATATAGAANVGSAITRINTPTFVGSITDIFPPASPLQGDQVFVDISTTGDVNNFDRLNAATGVTDANGNFSVTVAQALPDSNWNVGADGKIGTKDDIGASLARVRIVDQSGNTTLLPTSPFSDFYNQGAATGFILDTKSPLVTSVTPTPGTQLAPDTSGQVTITATFNENIDPNSLNANSVLVYRAGGSGTFVGLGTPVTIVPGSFNIAYLGGIKGPIRLTFKIQGPLANDFYRVILKGTGANPIRDIAGNPLDGAGTGTGGSDFTNSPFTVFSPANSRLIYVDGTNFPLDPTATQGTRFNAFTTITAGIAAAQTGDTILVLPGTYRENIVLKAQTKLISADPSSTDSFYLPGTPLATIIYGNPLVNSPYYNFQSGIITVNAADIPTVAGVPTEISGFTILNPLLGDSVTGSIDNTSIGIALNNSNVTVDKNYIVNAGIGVSIAATGSNVVGPAVNTNVIAGNYIGIQISDLGTGTTYAMPTQVINNTIVDNTYGLSNYSSRASTIQAYVLNDIFYNNHALTAARTGSGILSLTANSLVTVSNLFYANGVNNLPSSNVNGTFGAYLTPSSLSGIPNQFGNFTADPVFVAPRDPRPNGDTPAVFFRYANYDLSSRSPAINLATNAYAPATDILYRLPVAFAGRSVNGSGPASIGAFYYLGTGGITPTTGTPFTITTTTAPAGSVLSSLPTATSNSIVGGSLPLGTQFGVVNSSLNPDGVAAGKQGIATSITAPTTVTINFSDNINPATVQPSDLVVSGSGVSTTNPAKATGLTWVDSHTVKFLLSGGFDASGSVNLSIAEGAIQDRQGDSLAAYAEAFLLASQADVSTGPIASTPVGTTPTTSVAASAAPVQPVVAAVATVALPVQPIALAGPIAVSYTKSGVAKTHLSKAAIAAAKKAELAKAHAAKVHAAKEAAIAKHAAAVKQTAAKHAKAAK